MDLLKEIKFDKQGLIPAIIQDYSDNTVLMIGYMNKESLEKTLSSGMTCFWSRSRNELWVKGKESGNSQLVKEILFDCDGDSLLIKVEQRGGAACHTGYRSCFYRRVMKDGKLKTIGEKVFNPEDVYSKNRPQTTD